MDLRAGAHRRGIPRPAHDGVLGARALQGRAWLTVDPDNPAQGAVETTIQAHQLWTGEPQRDDHLRSSDFLDVGKHPLISFKSTGSECVGTNDYRVSGDLTIRGITRPIVLDMHYLGKSRTPYWTDAGDAGLVTRVGFVGEAHINRHDFQVNWNGQLENSGVVVSDEVFIKVDVETLLETELKRALCSVETLRFSSQKQEVMRQHS